MKKPCSRIPDAELDVMLALWNGHPDMTRQEIEDYMNPTKQLASTTILSMLSRLKKKGFVSVTSQGKTNLYTALISLEEYQRQEGSGMLKKLYGNSLKNFVAALYQGNSISENELAELEVFLEELAEKGE